MQNLYSSQQSLEMDRRSQDDFHIPGLTLMENASASAYRLIRKDIGNAKKTVFVAGGGNNGSKTIQIASDIKHRYEVESVAHLPCIGTAQDNP